MDQVFTRIKPNIIYRSNSFSMSTKIYFGCINSTESSYYIWKVNNVDTMVTIDISSNPTSLTPELTIPKNTLAYINLHLKLL